jgi:NMD protein affecting ribosome stability and mRNA decay
MTEGCPGADRFKKPVPEDIACPVCGEELEIWSDEFEAMCPKCRKKASRLGQSCLDWCKAARECAGEEVYKRYMDNKKKGV